MNTKLNELLERCNCMDDWFKGCDGTRTHPITNRDLIQAVIPLLREIHGLKKAWFDDMG
jgi:hypothetical protein